MSAYSKDEDGRIISLPGITPSSRRAASHEQTYCDQPSESFQLLPKIGVEMEAFLIIAKKNEATLLQERQVARKLREEIQDLTRKCSQLELELVNAKRENSLWNERLQGRMTTFGEQEKLAQERIRNLGTRIEELTQREISLKGQLQENDLNLKQFQKLIDDLKAKNEKWAFSYQHLTLETKKLKDHLGTQIGKLKRELSNWNKVASSYRKAEHVIEDYEAVKKKLESALEDLASEKRYREKLEELLKKERREKEIALTCLQTTEAKLNHVTSELSAAHSSSNLRSGGSTSRVSESGLKLDF